MENPPEAQTTQKTILVVDDDSFTLNFTVGILMSSYKVLSAHNGEEAVHIAEDYAEPIHLLLADFQMPGMSGIDLATKLTIA